MHLGMDTVPFFLVAGTDLDDLVWEESDEKVEEERCWEGESHEVEEGALYIRPHIPGLHQKEGPQDYHINFQFCGPDLHGPIVIWQPESGSSEQTINIKLKNKEYLFLHFFTFSE